MVNMDLFHLLLNKEVDNKGKTTLFEHILSFEKTKNAILVLESVLICLVPR